MSRVALSAIILVVGVLAVAPVHADPESDPPVVKRGLAPPRTSILLTPSILGPFGELTVERRIVSWLGLAAVGGYGWSLGRSATHDLHSVPTYDAGVQVRMHFFLPVSVNSSEVVVGMQAVYEHVRGSEPVAQSPFLPPPGLSVAPFVGMGTVFRNGFTLGFETGFPIYLVKEPLWNEMYPWSRVGWFQRVNIGWSFE